MRPHTVFYKTAKGQEELAQRRGELSLRDRRVLMLVNGERNLAEIGQLAAIARVDDYADILGNLSTGGYVQYEGGPKAPSAPSPAPTQSAGGVAPTSESGLSETQEFMLTTLQAFTNRFRVSKLVDDISNVDSDAELRNYLEPWYDAIAESPEGIFRADELRAKLLEKLLAAEKRVF